MQLALSWQRDCVKTLEKDEHRFSGYSGWGWLKG